MISHAVSSMYRQQQQSRSERIAYGKRRLDDVRGGRIYNNIGARLKRQATNKPYIFNTIYINLLSAGVGRDAPEKKQVKGCLELS